MSATGLDSSMFAKDYGLIGIETLKKVDASLKKYWLKLSYDKFSKEFVILGSAQLDKTQIEKIFSENKYVGYEPFVSNKHEDGNYRLKLFPLSSPQGMHLDSQMSTEGNVRTTLRIMEFLMRKIDERINRANFSNSSNH